MSLSEIEQHILAYWMQGQARDLNVAGRFYPYAELVMILDDKLKVATRKFGLRTHSKSKPAANAFLDMMLEKGGWSTKSQDFGGTMHQFQPDAYKTALAELTAADPIIQKADAEGDGYWEKTFADLTAR